MLYKRGNNCDDKGRYLKISNLAHHNDDSDVIVEEVIVKEGINKYPECRLTKYLSLFQL